MRFGGVLADAGYGCSARFRQAPSERRLEWAVGITGRDEVYPIDVAMIFPVAGRGRPRRHYVPDRASVTAETILADKTGRSVTWRHGTEGRLRTRFRAPRVRTADGSTQRIGTRGKRPLPGEAVWQVREERGSGERKVHLPNLPADATLDRRAATIKARWIRAQTHQRIATP